MCSKDASITAPDLKEMGPPQLYITGPDLKEMGPHLFITGPDLKEMGPHLYITDPDLKDGLPPTNLQAIGTCKSQGLMDYLSHQSLRRAHHAPGFYLGCHPSVHQEAINLVGFYRRGAIWGS